MLKIALCDDEKCELDSLNDMIQQYSGEKNIKVLVDAYATGEKLLQCAGKYDLIFLDIQMGDASGIDVARTMRESDKHVKIIYVTNFSNYQVDAFSVRAFGYVVKPISYAVLSKQLDDAIEYSQVEANAVTFTFHTNLGIKTINIEDIYFFESSNRKVEIVTKERMYKISDSIMNILDTFKPYGFSMPHKSFVINLMHVSSIKGYDVLLTSGDLIPISQKRAVDFKAEFHHYLKNNFNLLIKR
jgi:DNA-binding LytR/AlgR family response regulator